MMQECSCLVALERTFRVASVEGENALENRRVVPCLQADPRDLKPLVRLIERFEWPNWPHSRRRFDYPILAGLRLRFDWRPRLDWSMETQKFGDVE
jgi:hypothetical protein